MGNKYQTKYKSCSATSLGWRRIAKNVMRFGWKLESAEEHTETTVTDHYEVYETPVRKKWNGGYNSGYETDIYGNIVTKEEKRYLKTTKETKSRVYMDFCRNAVWYTNLSSIFLLEFLFNILLLVRRLLGFLLPLFIPACILVVLFGGGQAFAIYETPLPQLFTACFFGWLGLILAEDIVAFIASKILRPNIRR